MISLPFLLVALAMTAVVLLALIWPLLKRGRAAESASRQALAAAVYRDQLNELERDRAAGVLGDAELAASGNELQRRLLQEAATEDAPPATATVPRPAVRSAIAVALAVPLVAGLMYWALGNPDAQSQALAGANVTPEQVNQMVAGLAAKLEKSPDNPAGWAMLARSYKALDRYDDALKAFGRLGPLLNTDPGLLADYAETLAGKAGGNLEGPPRAAFEKALALDPDNLLALWLAGNAAAQRQEFAAAIRYWERMQMRLTPNSEDARAVAAAIGDARARGGIAATASSPAATPAAVKGHPAIAAKGDAAPGKGAVTGTVSLSPALAAQVKPDDVVFIFARAVEGPRMPLAVLRVRAGDLPAKFTLDDSVALDPARSMSSVNSLRVEAKISKTGQATPQPGDLVGESAPTKPGTTGVQVTIARTVL